MRNIKLDSIMGTMEDKFLFHMKNFNENQSNGKEIGILDQSAQSELESLIINNINKIDQLCTILLEFLNDKNLSYHLYLIESPHFQEIIQASLITLPLILYNFFIYLLNDSETLVISSIRQGILIPIFQPLYLQDPANSSLVHASLKVIRRMISTGPCARAFLFTAGLFKEIYKFLCLPLEICFPHFQYITHSFLIFVAGNPSHDFAIFTSERYPKRKTIIDLWKQFSSTLPEYQPILSSILKHIPGKNLQKQYLHSILILTNFLKYGNSFHINRELWHSLNLFLPIPSGPQLTSPTLYYVFLTYSFLAHNPKNIKYFYDLSITNLFRISISDLMKLNFDQNISIAYFNLIVELIFHSTPSEMYFLDQQGIFKIAYQSLFSDNEQLQILSLRILTNGLEKCESSIHEIIFEKGPEFLQHILSTIEDTPLKLRQELSWFLVCVLDSLNEDDRRVILTNDLFRFIMDVALSSTNQMGVVTLKLFLKFYAENIEEFKNFIRSEEMISEIEELSENGNEQVKALAFKLLEIINED